jgi:DNA methylase
LGGLVGEPHDGYNPESGKAHTNAGAALRRCQGYYWFRDPAFTKNKEVPLHRWVPWVAGLSAQFVQDCLDEYLPESDPSDLCVLDPFAGVGTTLVQAYIHGLNVVGFEINPFAALAARSKLEAARVPELLPSPLGTWSRVPYTARIVRVVHSLGNPEISI